MEITYYASNDTEQLEVEYPADASSASALVLSSAHTTNPMPISNMAIIFMDILCWFVMHFLHLLHF